MSSHEHHRFSSSERLKGYSEAVYAIVLTIMVIPLSNSVKHFDETTEFMEGLEEVYPKILIYMLAFLVIFDGWKDHVKVFEHVKWAGDSVIIANLMMLLPVTCYPFAWAVLGEFQDDARSIALLAGVIFFVGCLQLFIVCLTYRDKKYLDDNIHHDEDYKLMRISLIFDLGIHIIFTAIGGAISFASYITGYAFLCLGLFSSWLGNFFASYYLKCTNRIDRYGSVWGFIRASMITRRYDKGRFEVLADGVYAIVGTLIILDLSAEFNEMVEEHHLINFEDALNEEGNVFLSFIAIFFTMGFLWYDHHAVFNYVHKVNNLMSCFNMLSLMFIGFMPFAFKLTSQYAKIEMLSAINAVGHEVEEGHPTATAVTATESSNYTIPNHHDETIQPHVTSASSMAMQAGSFTVFWASIFHLFMWFSAHWQRARHMHSMKPYSKWKRGVVLAKLLVYPIFSLLIFLFSFNPKILSGTAVNLIGICIPLVYLLIKVVSDVTYKTYVIGHEINLEEERFSSNVPEKKNSCPRNDISLNTYPPREIYDPYPDNNHQIPFTLDTNKATESNNLMESAPLPQSGEKNNTKEKPSF